MLHSMLRQNLNKKSDIREITFLKRGSLLGNEEIDLGGDSPFFELEYGNFQYMLNL